MVVHAWGSVGMVGHACGYGGMGHGGMEVWRYGGMEVWRHGGMEAWRYGGMGGMVVHGGVRGYGGTRGHMGKWGHGLFFQEKKKLQWRVYRK